MNDLSLARWPHIIVSLLLLLTAANAAFAGDIEGGKDHSLVGRYEGSTIVYNNTQEFDEVALLQAPHDYGAVLERNAADDRSGLEWLTLKGRVTENRYQIPEGRSSLEVLENYEKVLTSQGFTTVFKCGDKNCLTGTVKDTYVLGQQLDPKNGESTAYFDHARYLLVKRDTPDTNVHVAVLVGEDKANTVAFVRVVEAKPIETDKIKVVKAEEMAKAIKAGGKINIYGILFDFDSSVIKPESKSTLDEIANLLKSSPELKLSIVGHTDNKGAADYNLELSSRRAASVVANLVATYGIEAARLSSSGAGLTQPVAPNETEEGRAKNRRVELVAN